MSQENGSNKDSAGNTPKPQTKADKPAKPNTTPTSIISKSATSDGESLRDAINKGKGKAD